jgi:YD repeat-containing protein
MNAIALKLDCSLTDLDWQVVELAKADGPRSINPDGRLTRFLRDFFGLPIAHTLANKRLEALRRFCVRAWFWDLIPTRDVRALMEAGYASVDVFQILAHVADFRGFTPSIEEGAI